MKSSSKKIGVAAFVAVLSLAGCSSGDGDGSAALGTSDQTGLGATLGQAHSTPTVWKTQLQENCLITVNDTCFKIKGITYSPSPVGYDASTGQALGDLFWDSYKTEDNGTTIWNWYSLWGDGHLEGTAYDARDDLGKIKALGVNTVRVYAMISRQLVPVNGQNPPPPESGHQYTHSQFLSKLAEKGLYALVDIPMPDTVYWKNKYDAAQANKTNDVAFWESVLEETVTELKDNPAVMGFDIMNEHDGDTTAFVAGNGPATAKTDFFYYQSIKYAKKVKEIAPDKLVGWAIHENPELIYWASNHQFTAGDLAGKTYFEELAKVFDYWGVNTYHADDLNAVLGSSPPAGQYTYPTLPADIKKPVIFTEFGWPTSGRVDDQTGGDIMISDLTRTRTGDTITKMYGQAYDTEAYKSIFAGAFFFSYSNEWWKSGDASTWNKTPNQIPNTFPNFFWDEEGFGLYSVSEIGKKDPVAGPWCLSSNAPCLPYDTLVEDKPASTKLAEFYATVN